MYCVTKFNFDGRDNNSTNVTDAKKLTYKSFRELAESFSDCIKGHKFQEYWVRGELEPIYRKDDNLKTSNLLVIDGDSSSGAFPGAPPIDDLIEILKELKLEHFIYTSHSHTADKTKFRCVIPCEEMTKQILKSTMGKLISVLNSMGYPIDYVKEMGTWSQPWFCPTRDDPEDKLFEWHYNPGEVLEHDEELPEDIVVTEIETTDSMSWQEHLDKVKLGEFHQHLIPLTMGLALDGVNEAMNLAFAQSAMEAVQYELKDDRWKTRMKDLPRIVKGAYAKLEDEAVTMDAITFEDIVVGEIPWPPGMLGELATLAYDQMVYQYKEIALINAVVVAGTPVARIFNVDSHDGISLNAYYTLVADSGMGKEALSSWPARMLIEAKPDLAIQSSFLGANSFTGPKAFHDELHDARSRLFILREAGFLLTQKSGNQAGLTAMVLDAYSKGHRSGMMSAAAYSSTDNSFGNLQAANPTIVSESTPDVLMAAYSDTNAMDSGHLPRQTIFRITGQRPYINTNPTKIDKDHHLKLKVKHLVDIGSKKQAVNDPEPYMLKFYDHKECNKFSHECTDIFNAERYSDPRKALMATRMFVKACKFAGIATVFNKEPNSARHLIIEKAEWEWAMRLCKFELSVVNQVFQGAFGEDKMEDLAIRVVGKICKKILDRSTALSKKHVSRDDMKRGRFKLFILRQSLKNQKEVISLANNFRSGFEVMMDYMYRNGYLVLRDEKGVKIIQVTNNFIQSLTFKD